MAQVSVRTEWRWRGFNSGLWTIVDIGLDNTEAIAAAAGTVAAAISGAALPPPDDIIVPLVLGAYGSQIQGQNHGNGVNIHVETTDVSVLPHYDVTIGSR